MKLLQSIAVLLFVLAAAGCASSTMSSVPMVPYGAPSGVSSTPWITAAGCDREIASRFGKSC